MRPSIKSVQATTIDVENKAYAVEVVQDMVHDALDELVEQCGEDGLEWASYDRLQLRLEIRLSDEAALTRVEGEQRE